MKKLTYKDLEVLINELKITNKSFYTNCYSDEVYFSALSDIEIKQYKNVIILLSKNDAYNILYFWTNSIDDLIKAFKDVINNQVNPIKLEIIYKKERTIINNIEQNTNFMYYGGIVRLQKKIDQNDIHYFQANYIAYATYSDIDEILTIHSNIFNIYIDRALEYNELKALVENKNVIIYKYNNEILGCIIYTKRGKFYHLRYWFVNKKNIGNHKGIGRKLIHTFYKIVGVGNFIEVWSRKDNNIVTEIYEHYGFKKDGLESDILIYSNDNNLINPLIPLN